MPFRVSNQKQRLLQLILSEALLTSAHPIISAAHFGSTNRKSFTITARPMVAVLSLHQLYTFVGHILEAT
jgi:hypothetical protein